MNTPATPTDMQTVVQDQIDALNDAASAIQSRPIVDNNAFTAVNDYEQDLESLYSAYGEDASIPDIDPASLNELDALLQNLRTAINDSTATSQIILGAAQAVAAFRGTTVP